jgi:hypothetical protein
VRRLILGFVAVAGLASIAPPPAEAAGPFQFHALTPCRVWNTRNGIGTPSRTTKMNVDEVVNVQIQGACGVPSGAKAVTLNVTIAEATQAGHLSMYPAGTAQPAVSTLNWNAGEPALANGAIVPLAAAAPDLAVKTFLLSGGQVHVIIDVTGYFM